MTIFFRRFAMESDEVPGLIPMRGNFAEFRLYRLSTGLSSSYSTSSDTTDGFI